MSIRRFFLKLMNLDFRYIRWQAQIEILHLIVLNKDMDYAKSILNTLKYEYTKGSPKDYSTHIEEQIIAEKII